jgi:hypothetical protein
MVCRTLAGIAQGEQQVPIFITFFYLQAASIFALLL